MFVYIHFNLQSAIKVADVSPEAVEEFAPPSTHVVVGVAVDHFVEWVDAGLVQFFIHSFMRRHVRNVVDVFRLRDSHNGDYTRTTSVTFG